MRTLSGLSTLPALLALTLAMTLTLSGCETTKLGDAGSTVSVETRSPTSSATPGGTGATAAAAPQSRVASVDLANTASAGASLTLPGQRVLYFDFDSFAIKDDYKPLLDGYAKVLSTAKAKRMVIEGYTDERGGREYNLALGQKRAQAVLKSLTLLGAADTQLEAVSFGEERPAATGSDESAWAKNRRAELKDR